MVIRTKGFPRWHSGKESACPKKKKESACRCRRHRDAGSIPESGRSSGEGNGNPLQYPCLENPMDRGVLYAIVHGVAKNQT